VCRVHEANLHVPLRCERVLHRQLTNKQGVLITLTAAPAREQQVAAGKTLRGVGHCYFLEHR